MIPRPHYRSLPRRFRRATLLIVGCGDVGTRAARQVLARHTPDRLRVLGTTRSAASADALRSMGVVPLRVDLDAGHGRPAQKSDAPSLGAPPKRIEHLRALARWMIDLAPPPNEGPGDPRTRRLLAALGLPAHRAPRFGARAGQSRATPLDFGTAVARRWVYVSTTGVYGDTGGSEFDESRPVAPKSARAVRRVHAERHLRAAGRRGLGRVTIVRAPGIYAEDRLPIERLRKGLPALVPGEDVWTNHIHAEDLAAITVAALFRGRANRVVHAVDDSNLKMGDYFDRVADAFEMARPPRVSRSELATLVSPMMLSFMSESRRLQNRRLKHELRVRLAYPEVDDTLAAARIRASDPML